MKSDYVTLGSYQNIWIDAGSGAYKNVGLFSNSEIGSIKAIFANTFTSKASHSRPGGKPNLLSSDYAILNSLIHRSDLQNLALIVYQGSDMDLIWKDSGSGAWFDVSIYRSKGPDGYYSVGDIAVQSHYQPRASFLVKARSNDALALPVDFHWRWNDAGSGADWDVTFWMPACPYGYVPLGHVAVRNHDDKPKNTDATCVKYEYVVAGSWQWLWYDRGSGADRDVTIYTSVPNNNNGQGMNAMGILLHIMEIWINQHTFSNQVLFSL